MPTRTAHSYLGIGTDFGLKPVTANTVLTLSCENIKEENLLRVVSNNVDGDYVVLAKLIAEESFTPIFVGTGTVDTVLDISTYDIIQVEAATDITQGTLAISAFLTPGDVSTINSGGDASAANQVAGNAILAQIVAELNEDVDCAEIPTVINEDVNGIGIIYDVTLPVDCKKFTIRHRDGGNIEFAFENTLSSHFTVKKGCSLSEDGLCLPNTTIYFRSNKIGTVEVIAYT